MTNFAITDIYPNPAANYFTFTFISGNGTEKEKLQVSIYSADKKTPVFHQVFEELVSFMQYTIKTNKITSGNYDVVFSMNGTRVLKKLSISNNKEVFAKI